MWLYDKKEIGERIRNRRKALGMTQFEFAEKIGRVPKYCADIERGTCGMSIDTMMAMCYALRMSPNTLLFGESVAAFEDAEDVSKYALALAECTQEQRESIYQMIRLFTKAAQ